MASILLSSSPTPAISPSSTDSSNSALDILDSPSRQLLRELQLLHIYERQNFYNELDQRELRRAQEHREGLAATAARHEAIRLGAERELQRYYEAVEQQRRKEEEERRRKEEALERERREREEAERRRREAAERAKAEEAARKAAEAAERERLAEEKRREEVAKQKAKAEAEAEQKTREAEAAAAAATAKAKADQEQAAAASAASKPPVGLTSRADKEAEQRRYLEIHRNLKDLRKFMVNETKKNPQLKARMGDMRRAIRKCLGQLTDVKGKNAHPRKEIADILREAINFPGPTVDLRKFLANPPPELANSPQQAPALLIYLFNALSKAAINQFINEAGVSTKQAEPVGILIALMFSTPDFKYDAKYTMIDILIAKFRVVCPVLWGIYGDEKTPAGKKRCGWHFDDDHFIDEQRHTERMTGLGTGFASIALRNFEKSQNSNPFPNSNYWRSLAGILNVPPAEIQSTHLIVLKAMIMDHEEKLLSFFGNAGRAALRKALVDFPASVPVQTAASKSVSLLAEVLAKDQHLFL